MTRGRRPSIFRIGHVDVTQHGLTPIVQVYGWGIGLCAANCNCHRHPEGHHLTVLEDQVHGTLGLARHGGPCDCCQPWTADELAGILRDLADVATLMAEA